MKTIKSNLAVNPLASLNLLKLKIITRLLAGFVVFFMYASCAVAARTEAGTIAFVQGSVTIMRETKRGVFVDAGVGDKVSEGDIIKTGKNAKAEVNLSDGSVIHIAAASQMQLKQYIVDSKTANRKVVVATNEGKLRFVVSKVIKAAAKAESKWKTTDFTIETPTAVAGIQGTDFVVTVSRGVSNIAVFEGYVRIGSVSYRVQGSITLAANQASTVKKDEAPKQEDVKTVTEAQKTLLQLETTPQQQAAAGAAPTADEASQIQAALQAVIDELGKAQEGKTPEQLVAAALAAGLDVNQTMTATIEQGIDLPAAIAAASSQGVNAADTIQALLNSGETLNDIVQAAQEAGLTNDQIIQAAQDVGVPVDKVTEATKAPTINVDPKTTTTPAGSESAP